MLRSVRIVASLCLAIPLPNRAYDMPSHVVIHDRVPPPSACSAVFTSCAVGAGEAPSWARGRARNAPRTSTKYAPATIHSADDRTPGSRD